MKRQVDVPIARLVLDLKERGLLRRTLIVVASEFGRNTLIRANQPIDELSVA